MILSINNALDISNGTITCKDKCKTLHESYISLYRVRATYLVAILANLFAAFF